MCADPPQDLGIGLYSSKKEKILILPYYVDSPLKDNIGKWQIMVKRAIFLNRGFCQTNLSGSDLQTSVYQQGPHLTLISGSKRPRR